MKRTLNNLVLANGRVIVIKEFNTNIATVIKVAKNARFEGLPVLIEEGQTIILDSSSTWAYSDIIVEDVKYKIIKPSNIIGLFTDNK